MFENRHTDPDGSESDCRADRCPVCGTAVQNQQTKAVGKLIDAVDELLEMPLVQLVENKKQFDFRNLRQCRDELRRQNDQRRNTET